MFTKDDEAELWRVPLPKEYDHLPAKNGFIQGVGRHFLDGIKNGIADIRSKPSWKERVLSSASKSIPYSPITAIALTFVTGNPIPTILYVASGFTALNIAYHVKIAFQKACASPNSKHQVKAAGIAKIKAIAAEAKPIIALGHEAGQANLALRGAFSQAALIARVNVQGIKKDIEHGKKTRSAEANLEAIKVIEKFAKQAGQTRKVEGMEARTIVVPEKVVVTLQNFTALAAGDMAEIGSSKIELYKHTYFDVYKKLRMLGNQLKPTGETLDGTMYSPTDLMALSNTFQQIAYNLQELQNETALLQQALNGFVKKGQDAIDELKAGLGMPKRNLGIQ